MMIKTAMEQHSPEMLFVLQDRWQDNAESIIAIEQLLTNALTVHYEVAEELDFLDTLLMYRIADDNC